MELPCVMVSGEPPLSPPTPVPAAAAFFAAASLSRFFAAFAALYARFKTFTIASSAFSSAGGRSSSTANLSMVFWRSIRHCSHASIAATSSCFPFSPNEEPWIHLLETKMSGHRSRGLPVRHSS